MLNIIYLQRNGKWNHNRWKDQYAFLYYGLLMINKKEYATEWRNFKKKNPGLCQDRQKIILIHMKLRKSKYIRKLNNQRKHLKWFRSKTQLLLIPSKSVPTNIIFHKITAFYPSSCSGWKPWRHSVWYPVVRDGNLFFAKGHMDIYNIICGPYKVVKLKISLLYFIKHSINSPLMPFHRPDSL